MSIGDRLGSLVVGLVIGGIGYGLMMKLDGWPQWIGVLLMGLGGCAVVGAFTGEKKDYFCADCGQYIGDKPARCDRCGCNRYTTDDPGAGATIKRR